jgi:hypothetical protein
MGQKERTSLRPRSSSSGTRNPSVRPTYAISSAHELSPSPLKTSANAPPSSILMSRTTATGIHSRVEQSQPPQTAKQQTKSSDKCSHTRVSSTCTVRRYVGGSSWYDSSTSITVATAASSSSRFSQFPILNARPLRSTRSLLYPTHITSISLPSLG